MDSAGQKQDAYNSKLQETQQAGRDVARARATFGGDIVKDFDSAGDAARRLLECITDLIVELLMVKPLMNALAPAGGAVSWVASSAASSPMVALRAGPTW